MKLNIELNMLRFSDVQEVHRFLLGVDKVLADSATKFVRPGIHEWVKQSEKSSIMVVPYEVTLDCEELMQAYRRSGYEVDEGNQIVGINNDTGKCIVKDLFNVVYHVARVFLTIEHDKLCAEMEGRDGEEYDMGAHI